MENSLQNSPESNAIRQRMEDVRRDLDEGVQEIVEGARDMGDWRSYVKSHPWICLGGALAVGYLIAPRRILRIQPDATTLAELAKQSRLLAAANSTSKAGLCGSVLSVVGNMVLRGVVSYVGQQAVRLLSAEAVESQQDDHP